MNMMQGLTAGTNYSTAIELIGRYPELTKDELHVLLSIYPHLSPVEMALMISNDDIAARLDAFNRAHPKLGRTPFGHYGVFVGIFVVGLALIAWKLVLGG